MKKILALIAVIGLTACSKETTLPTQKPQTVLVRVESVSKAGSVTYSEIVSLKLK